MRNVAVLGASGYTGAELVRLILGHPEMKITALAADRRAGALMGDVFPQFAHLSDLPRLVAIEEVDFAAVDLVFCALPNGITQDVVASLPAGVKTVDLSADFRLRDTALYEEWYGGTHRAPDLQSEAVYGLPEFYRDEIKDARIIANTGCYVAASLLPLIPLLRAEVIDPEDIVIDAKSGVTGAGRGVAEAKLYTEVTGGFHAYGVARHKHMPEIEQELSAAAGKPVLPSFTPHLLPRSRGILATIYAKGEASAVLSALEATYADEPFVHTLPLGETPQTRHVTGSNMCRIGVVADRRPGRVIIISVIDNLMKGASGQAVQNANIALGLDETLGLSGAPLFP